MKLYLSPEMERDLRKAISHDDLEKFSKLTSPLRWGKASWSASQLLLQALEGEKERLWPWAVNLSKHENPHTRCHASELLLKLWEKDRNKAEQILATLADDEHWLVRESTHSVWGELLRKHFEQVYPVLNSWNKSSSANLKRCVAIAARSAGNLRKIEWKEPLLKLLIPLLPDKTAYVRKNLGPFAIGDGMLRCYPDFTLKHLRKLALKMDEGTRWNVAMAFASYGGNKNWREGVKILTRLAADERRYVWRAVASALLYLARRHPEIHDMLKDWLKDSKRAKVAETTLEYLARRS